MKKKVVQLVIDPPSPRSAAMQVITEQYGHFCSPGEPRKEGKKIIVPILADVPVRRMKEIVEYESLGEVAQIEIDPETMRAIRYPSFKGLSAIMEKKLKAHTQETE